MLKKNKSFSEILILINNLIIIFHIFCFQKKHKKYSLVKTYDFISKRFHIVNYKY